MGFQGAVFKSGASDYTLEDGERPQGPFEGRGQRAETRNGHKTSKSYLLTNQFRASLLALMTIPHFV